MAASRSSGWPGLRVSSPDGFISRAAQTLCVLPQPVWRLNTLAQQHHTTTTPKCEHVCAYEIVCVCVDQCLECYALTHGIGFSFVLGIEWVRDNFSKMYFKVLHQNISCYLEFKVLCFRVLYWWLVPLDHVHVHTLHGWFALHLSENQHRDQGDWETVTRACAADIKKWKKANWGTWLWFIRERISNLCIHLECVQQAELVIYFLHNIVIWQLFLCHPFRDRNHFTLNSQSDDWRGEHTDDNCHNAFFFLFNDELCQKTKCPETRLHFDTSEV